MSYIVKEGRGDDVARAFTGHSLPKRQVEVDLSQASYKALHDVRGAQSVGEPRVLCTRKSEGGKTELPDPTEALHFASLEEQGHDSVFFALEGHEPMHGVSEDQALPFVRRGTRSRPKSPLRAMLSIGLMPSGWSTKAHSYKLEASV